MITRRSEMGIIQIASKVRGGIDYFLHPSMKGDWQGPFNGQEFRQLMYLELLKSFRFAAIVETGTFRGKTTEYFQSTSGLPVYTVEINPTFYGYSKTRFFRNTKVHTYCGDSRWFLTLLFKKEQLRAEEIFFYLDAHWEKDLPLREEIETIFSTNDKAVVMVDDFKVPGDDAYLYDDYGEGNECSLDYLFPVVSKLKIAAFFPSRRAELETGAKRGCVVLARSPDVIAILANLPTLSPYVR
jgi:hypothetical protein